MKAAGKQQTVERGGGGGILLRVGWGTMVRNPKIARSRLVLVDLTL